MIELIQFPWSPFCLVQRRILEFARIRFKIVNIPPSDRSLVWRLTRHRYYAVPIIKDGRTVVFETGEDTQVIAKYLDNRFDLELFPRQWAGLQSVLWRYFEHELEMTGFKLNDAYFEEFVPPKERLNYLRHKERKFGPGCLQAWRSQQTQLLQAWAELLQPCEQMLGTRPFLLDQQPRFVDFNLMGILDNVLYSGHYQLPNAHTRLMDWHGRMTRQIHSGRPR